MMTDRLTVLVVDDEEKIRAGCKRILTGSDYHALTAENGRVALDVLEKTEVDIMLLDLRMPVMEGEQVLDVTSRKYPELPVIIITGHGTVDTAVECMKKGAYDFVTKPFKMNQFLITVARAAEKRRLERKARLAEIENVRNLYDLNLEKSRLKTIVNCLANGVMVTNRNLEVVLYNSAWARLMNCREECSTPAPLDDFLTHEGILQTLNDILSCQSGSGELVYQELEKNGRALRAISAPAPGPEEDVAGTVTVLEDVTMFKQLDQMKSDFINMVAHELRNPLHSVRQLLTVQLEGLCGRLGEKQEDFLGRSVKQIDGLLELIRDLLDISKAESGILIQHHVPVDLEEIVKKVMEIMEVRATRQGIALDCVVSGHPIIQADARSMEEVFNNLLSNAVNYSPDGGRVTVDLNQCGDFVEIKVTDTGIGIDPEEVPRIFDKFYRIKHPRTRDVTGTGLGLSLVKSIVEAHRGALEVISRPNDGTCFRIQLPALKQETEMCQDI